MTTEQQLRALEVQTEWNGKANVCIHCGRVPETVYIATGHDHTDDSFRWCKCREKPEQLRAELDRQQARIVELEAQADPEALHIAYLHGQSAANETTRNQAARIVELEQSLRSRDRDCDAKNLRISSLEAENARLKAECDDIKQVQFPRKVEAVATGWKKQLAASQEENKLIMMNLTQCGEQLAAEQLRNEKLREALSSWINIASNCSIEYGCCCCGDDMKNHANPMSCGHSPVDMADSVVHKAIEDTDKALSEPHDTAALDAYVADKIKEAGK